MLTTSELNQHTPTATDPSPLTKVLVFDSQPVVIAGLRALLDLHEDFLTAESADSLAQARDLVRDNDIDVLIIDKGLAVGVICEWILSIQNAKAPPPAIVVWGTTVSEHDTLQLLRIGVLGILRKTVELSTVVCCLRAVARGQRWIDESLFRYTIGGVQSRKTLTAREEQVLELVQHGLPNKEIAQALGICTGTVKIHLKHIFEKSGVRGRHSLAIGRMFIGCNDPSTLVDSAAA